MPTIELMTPADFLNLLKTKGSNAIVFKERKPKVNNAAADSKVAQFDTKYADVLFATEKGESIVHLHNTASKLGTKNIIGTGVTSPEDTKYINDKQEVSFEINMNTTDELEEALKLFDEYREEAITRCIKEGKLDKVWTINKRNRTVDMYRTNYSESCPDKDLAGQPFPDGPRFRVFVDFRVFKNATEPISMIYDARTASIVQNDKGETVVKYEEMLTNGQKLDKNNSYSILTKGTAIEEYRFVFGQASKSAQGVSTRIIVKSAAITPRASSFDVPVAKPSDDFVAQILKQQQEQKQKEKSGGGVQSSSNNADTDHDEANLDNVLEDLG